MFGDNPGNREWFPTLPPAAAAATALVRRLAEAGHAAYLVGGAVRDLALGIEPGDFDVATDARPERIAELFPSTSFVGAAFGVSLVPSEGNRVEVATFRREGAYADGRHPDRVEFSDSPVEDARRRDFTVNAVFLDPVAGEILDPAGGLADCERKILRTVGTPADRFGEDGLRLLRAARLCARCGLDVEPATRRAMSDCREILHAISPERIGQELARMLTGPTPSHALELLRETGVLELFLPEIAALHGVPQPPDHHPEGDVWTHTMILLDLAETPSLELALGALLHDVGKPATLSRSGGRIRFHGHETKGVEMAREILERLRFSGRVRDHVLVLIGQHMRFLDAREMRTSTLARFMRQAQFKEMLELFRLDRLAANGDLAIHAFCRERLESMTDEGLSPDPLLSGEDLLSLGVPKGPRVGALLRELETEQLEGRVTDEATARSWIRKRFAEDQ